MCPQYNKCLMIAASAEEMRNIEDQHIARLNEANNGADDDQKPHRPWPSWCEVEAQAELSPRSGRSCDVPGVTDSTETGQSESEAVEREVPEWAPENTMKESVVGRIVVAGEGHTVEHVQPGTLGIVRTSFGEHVWVSWNRGPGVPPGIERMKGDKVVFANKEQEEEALSVQKKDGWVVYCDLDNETIYPVYGRISDGKSFWDRPDEVSLVFAQVEYGRAIMRWIRDHIDEIANVKRFSLDFRP